MKGLKNDSGISLGRLIVNLTASLAVTAVLVMIFALILCYSDLSEKWISLGAKVITVFSVCLSGALCAKSSRRRGWMMGGISALLYMALLHIAGYFVFGKTELGAAALLRLVYAVIAGMVGGIIGINLKKSS